MPISYALLLCIPIGLLAYFEARWTIRYVLGRYEQRERRAARLIGVYGALIIPLIYVCGLAGDSFSQPTGKIVTAVLFSSITAAFIGPMFVVLFDRRLRGDGSNH